MYRFLLLLAAGAAVAVAQNGELRTMRLDYVHSGSASEENFAVDGVSLEGAWPGPLDRWIDETNLGKYYFQVLDRATNRLIYSRGFASIYGEWETTDEAKQQRRALPRKPALSGAGRARAGRSQEARAAQRIPRGLVHPDRPRRPGHRPQRAAQTERLGSDAERRPARQGRPAAAGRRLHGRRNGEVASRRAPYGGHAVRRLAVQGASPGLQRLGHRYARRRRAAFRGPQTASTGVRRLRASYDAFGSERYVLDLRQQAPARDRQRPRRTSSSRSSSTTANTAAAASSTSTPPSRPTTPSRPTSSFTNSATTSPASRTNTTLPTSPTAAPPRVPNPGSRTPPPTRARRSGRTC